MLMPATTTPAAAFSRGSDARIDGRPLLPPPEYAPGSRGHYMYMLGWRDCDKFFGAWSPKWPIRRLPAVDGRVGSGR